MLIYLHLLYLIISFNEYLVIQEGVKVVDIENNETINLSFIKWQNIILVYLPYLILYSA